MAGASKKRAQREREEKAASKSSSSGVINSSATSTVSRASRPAVDGHQDPAPAAASATPTASTVQNKNMDLSVNAYSVMHGAKFAMHDPRPKPSNLGIPIKMGLNTFHVIETPTKKVYQYDVMIGNGAEKPGLVRKVWQSKAVEAVIGKGSFIFDGSRLAWACKTLGREVRISVDLDAEEKRIPRPGKEGQNTHRVVIRQTSDINFNTLVAYLDGKVAFDNKILEAINFLDHLLREWPSQKYTPIKRAFFSYDRANPTTLGSGVEALKGVYQSMRIVHGGPTAKARLSINVDVANGTFWTEAEFINAVIHLVGCRDVAELCNTLRSSGEKGRAGQSLKKMRKLHVVASHRGQKDTYIVDKFVYQSPKEVKIDTPEGKTMTMYQFYLSKYNYRIQNLDLPLVKMTRGKNTLLPMEALRLAPMQRYAFKMDERQTSNMIRFAVTPPPQRMSDIEHGLKSLDWHSDPIHKNFGLKIDPKKVEVDARLIPAPTVKFRAGEAKPGTSGRWDLKGKKFLHVPDAALKSWSVCIISGRRGGKPEKSIVQGFIREFVTVYLGHGAKVDNHSPATLVTHGDDVAGWVTAAWNAAGNQSNARPQILVFILPDKDSITYGRIKRSCECRYGVVSQCMQYSHVQKGQPQYIGNVLMKFNAKLGGDTARASGPTSSGDDGLFTVPTMVIGADVSHAAPGAQTPSMAAITMSSNKLATRYSAACQTNGFRVEMITTETINTELKAMAQDWFKNVGGGRMPSRIIYFRDGVSEGQYQHVIEQEVRDMKALFKTAAPTSNIQFVVIVGTKRHHVRFFPPPGKGGDRNGNPLPGTLVETGVTHPYENDFYLCSHAAIKGTARPMHYYVLLNEAKMTNEEIQLLIYEHSYQYIRATTPVSQHPAMYYAHIVSNRAIPHDPKWSGSSDGTPATQVSAARPTPAARPNQSGGDSTQLPPDAEKLLAMPNAGNIMASMWYI